MSKDRTEAESERGNAPEQPRQSRLAGLRAQSGFRTAVIAFVLTVVLGIGGTAAYAYWSKSVAVPITGSTRSDLPANTTLVGAQPALAARPGTVSTASCVAPKTQLEMIDDTNTEIDFSWSPATRATSYVVTIRSDSSYVYQRTQRVTVPTAKFVFERLKSDKYGNQKGENPPFYTKYTVRILPMNGDVPGDPFYHALEYAHWSSANCNPGVGAAAPQASPVGNISMTCALPAFTAGAAYTESKFTWTSSAGATSYIVTMRALNGSGYGGEQVVTGVNAAFRVMQPQPVPSGAPYLGKYTVRVQPMKGTEAGDPRYLIYQLGTDSHECWDEGANYRPPSSS